MDDLLLNLGNFVLVSNILLSHHPYIGYRICIQHHIQYNTQYIISACVWWMLVLYSEITKKFLSRNTENCNSRINRLHTIPQNGDTIYLKKKFWWFTITLLHQP